MRLEIRRIYKFLIAFMIILGVFLIGTAVWYVNQLKKADKQADGFKEQFYNDLLEENYNSILSYTYVPDGKTITEDEVKELLLGYEGMELMLQNKEQLEVNEFGNTELRVIEVKGYDVNGKRYYHQIDIKMIDDEMYLDFNIED